MVSIALTGPAVARLGERRAMAVGLAFGVAGFALFALAPTGWLFLAAIPLLSLWALTGPALQALMSRRVGADEQGRLQGALAGLRGITGMIGPVLFTQSFALGIAPEAGLDSPGLPYGLAAALLASALVLAWRITRVEGVRSDARAGPAAGGMSTAGVGWVRDREPNTVRHRLQPQDQVARMRRRTIRLQPDIAALMVGQPLDRQGPAPAAAQRLDQDGRRAATGRGGPDAAASRSRPMAPAGDTAPCRERAGS